MLRILILSFLTVATHSSNAQIKPFSIGPYVQKTWMKGDTKLALKDGWGAGITADIKLPARLSLTGSAGYFYAAGQEGLPSIKAFPIKAGIKIRPIPLFYLKMEAGAAAINKESEKGFLWSPGVGIRLLSFDLQGSYEQWSGPRPMKYWAVTASIQL